jgi:2-methylisocitrate lyase-like PEP mutase family enzyme
MTVPAGPSERLRQLLRGPDFLSMPCCFDALSARLVEEARFPLTFMSGFAVSATRLAAPDTGLISYGEMLDQGRNICGAVGIPVIGDGDTGYGNPLNVQRTVRGYAQIGFAAVMIEDQVAPKRCGHTRGKQTVDRKEALGRIKAAVEAKSDRSIGNDILILARTDACATDGFDEALYRARAFEDAGADIVFLEAPRSIEQMEAFCKAVRVPKLANMVEGGDTPLLTPVQLASMGYKIAAYPLTLLSASIHAMQKALAAFQAGQHPKDLLSFAELRKTVGFDAYDEALLRLDHSTD